MASFEEQLRELEDIVRKLEGNDLTLEESIAVFERGNTLTHECRVELEKAESRIQAVMNAGRPSERIEDIGMAVAEGEDDE
jgi:exodeoxyribonuclease VII small subunit